MVPLAVSHDVDIHQKSKMAVANMKCIDFTAIWLKVHISNTQWAILYVHVLNEKYVDAR